MWTIELAVMLLMIGLNSIFAAYEISLAALGVGRLHSLHADGKRGAEAAVRMKQNIEGSLAVVQEAYLANSQADYDGGSPEAA